MQKPEVRKDSNKETVSFLTLDDSTEKLIHEKIKNLFSKKDFDHTDMIYNCVKELMVNASKSNIKKTFFLEASINEKDKEIYQNAIKKVKKLFNEEYFAYLQFKLKKHGHFVEVSFDERADGVIITVLNPTPLLEEEEKKIRQNLYKAMKGDDYSLALYYSANDEASEGASLGLILVINILKSININPEFFRIGTVSNNTVARIEIPFNNNYKPQRNRQYQ